jgi:hypothetical protein
MGAPLFWKRGFGSACGAGRKRRELAGLDLPTSWEEWREDNERAIGESARHAGSISASVQFLALDTNKNFLLFGDTKSAITQRKHSN